MFSNLTIRTRLALAMGFLGLLMAIGAALGVTGIALSNADQKEMYTDDLASASALGAALTLRQLDHPERSYGRIRLWGTVGWAGAGWLLTAWLHTFKPSLLGAPSGGTTLADSFAPGAAISHRFRAAKVEALRRGLGLD